ncbi:MAG: protein kinase [Polyangia bacterium]|jgi:serine/threonine protein kinase|nr:protein kinase [Polyangia bacterium]
MSQGSLSGRVLAGRFRLLELIGWGAVGEVYLAEHLTLPRRHAIKVLKPQFQADPRLMERFRREAAAASRLTHPNIVYISDFGQAEDGRLYLAMEHVDGASLDVLVEEQLPGVMPLRRVLRILEQLADALGAAHGAGIIHRDLKPENIMVHKGIHGDEQVKVLDFGLAKVMVDTDIFHLTHRGEIFGTPMFMSPEQARGAEVDHRTDIYSFGAVAYELLTGRPPFEGETLQEIIVANQTIVPAPSSALRPVSAPRLPGSLDRLVEACLEKDRERRPASMAEVKRSLEDCKDRLQRPTSSYGAVPRSLSCARPAVSSAALGALGSGGAPEASSQAHGARWEPTAPAFPHAAGDEPGLAEPRPTRSPAQVDFATAPTIGPLDAITAAAVAGALVLPAPPSKMEPSPYDRARVARMAVKDPWHFRQVMRCARAVGEGLARRLGESGQALVLMDTLGELSESEASLRALEDELTVPTERLEVLEQGFRERADRLRLAVIDLSLERARIAEDERASREALDDLGFQIRCLEERLAELYAEAAEATLGLQRELAELEGQRSDLRQERVAPQLRLLGLILGARGAEAAGQLMGLYEELDGLLGGAR